MEEDKLFKHVKTLSEKKRAAEAGRLGAVVHWFVDERLKQKYNKYKKLNLIWEKLLPEELMRHCSIDSLESGCLTIMADSPAYNYQIKLLSTELQRKLNELCPSLRIKQIKSTVGKPAQRIM